MKTRLVFASAIAAGFAFAVRAAATEQQAGYNKTASNSSLVTRHSSLPKVWMSVQWREPFEDSVRQCAEQGVDVVEVPTWPTQCTNILPLLRKYGVKGFTHSGFNPSQDARPAVNGGRPLERAVCSGGAYRGLSIDRYLFSFTPGPHEIVIEPPVYSGRQPYTRRVKDADGTERTVKAGHYFGNLRPTGFAEIVVPEKLFDGAPHVRIIPCEVLPVEPGDAPENDTSAGMAGPEIENRRLVKLRFDLSGCDDCLLDKVGIAVYWESDPESENWKAGHGELSVFSPLTRAEMRRAGHERAQLWVDANGGTFPSNEIVALRFGDENFNLTGWLDAPACSFPLWGFSESGRAAFAAAAGAEAHRSEIVQPRTWGCPEIYGAEAYAIALYEYHKAAAALAREYREGIREVTPDMMIFRNTTRAGAWAEGNDHDGTGQELLARELDFLHIDPYPCANKYYAETIPADMGYMAGLARRYGKPLLPWMQAHGAASLTLGHPTPADMDRMWAQHLPFSPAGMMWLGFDNDPRGNSTFPRGSPESWAHAKEMFAELHAAKPHEAGAEAPRSDIAPLAIVRPYSTRAVGCSLGDWRWRNPADRILEAFAMAWGVDNGLQYDIFELPPEGVEVPRSDSKTATNSSLVTRHSSLTAALADELSRYPLVVSTIPLPGVPNVRVLGEGTEGTTISSKELVAMRKAFAAEIAANTAASPQETSLVRVAADLARATSAHPRLFATAEDFAALCERVAADTLLRDAVANLRREADADCTAPPLEHKLEGRRLLRVAWECIKRVFDCATVYKITGETKYRDGALRAVDEALSFPDWNPAHFLDTAGFALAVATAYDWLYEELGDDRRKRMEEGLVRLAVEPSFEGDPAWLGWIGTENNWNSVCHSGMMAAAFALKDVNPGLAARTIHRAVANLWRPMGVLAPNGGYPEGADYWEYGIGWHVLAMDMLENILGTSYGLSEIAGWKETADYLNLVTGPSGLFFNFSDSSMERKEPTHALWWFAQRYGRPDIVAGAESGIFARSSRNEFGLFALSVLWYRPVPPDAKPLTPLFWSSEGRTPIVVQRSDSTPDALYVAIKGGTPSASHGHMDVGSFVLDACGVRWAYDLVKELYHDIEKRGMNLWDNRQDSDRWKVFRLGTYAHNTLVIDGAQQKVDAFATVATNGATATIDLTPLYPAAKSVVRTGAMEQDGCSYTLRDEIHGLAPGATVRWAMMTRAAVVRAEDPALLLEEAGRTLFMEQLGGEWEWRVEENPHPNEWDSPNEGYRQITFTVTADANGDAAFGVKFTPRR